MRDHDYEERGAMQRYGFPIGIGAVVILVLVLVIGHHSTGDNSPAPKRPDIVMVHPVLPTPPPPVTPPPEPPKEVVEKMVEQTPLDHPEDKPEPPKEASAPVTTNVAAGSGSDAFGLGGGKGGMGGGGGGEGGGSHSRFGWYAGQVQRAIQAALSHNRVTGQAEFTDRIKVWADNTGRVTQIRLERSTGNPDVDQAINEALNGLQLQEAPPGDMPMPILMRIVARRHT